MRLSDLIKEYFEISSLSDKDQKEYYLIKRYEKKVSRRLLKRKQDLRIKARESFDELIERVISTSPILYSKLSPVDSNFYCAPVKFKI